MTLRQAEITMASSASHVVGGRAAEMTRVKAALITAGLDVMDLVGSEGRAVLAGANSELSQDDFCCWVAKILNPGPPAQRLRALVTIDRGNYN